MSTNDIIDEIRKAIDVDRSALRVPARNGVVDLAEYRYAADRQLAAWDRAKGPAFYQEQLRALAIEVRAGGHAQWTPEQLARLLEDVAAGREWETGAWR